jgi:hypothetical protein
MGYGRDFVPSEFDFIPERNECDSVQKFLRSNYKAGDQAVLLD